MPEFDPLDLDASKASDWTLAQTLAWIVWRTPDAVRQYSNEVLRRMAGGIESIRTSGGSTFPNDVLHQAMSDTAEKSPRCLFNGPRAHAELRQKLEDGSLEAFGSASNALGGMLIPSNVWRGLDLLNGDMGEPDTIPSFNRQQIYRQVRVRREHVQKLWDAKDEPPKKRGRKSALDPNQVREFVFEMMDLNGRFSHERLHWNAQARLEKAVRQKFKFEGADSTLRAAIRQPLETWLASMDGN